MKNINETKKFKFWERNLIRNGLKILNIKEQFTRYAENGEPLFSTVMLDAITPEGDKIPPICFLKGQVVCILTCLINIESKEKYLLLVKQRRIGNGGFTYEHPAGMVDDGMKALDVAQKEVFEETGIELKKENLINLSPNKLLYPSPGTSDEAMHFFFCELHMSIEQINQFRNKNMGKKDEYERITTYVFPFVEGHRKITNTNLLLLDHMYLCHTKDFATIEQICIQP